MNPGYECQISLLKVIENDEKMVFNVTEEPDTINATLDIGRSLRQIITAWCSFGPYVSSY